MKQSKRFILLIRNVTSAFRILFILFPLLLNAQEYRLVIHGGAGNLNRDNLSQEFIEQSENALAQAIILGEKMLKEGKSSLDVVEAVVRFLEDAPQFNAGKGAVFNMDGKNELDASIMCGKTLNAGAVATVTTIKNPVTAARKVMENSPHVFLTGRGAEAFAYEQGAEIVEASYFFDQRRWDQYREFIRRNRQQERGELFPTELPSVESDYLGTVGAVALDVHGNLAAATSTGGMLGKKYGRIGDSPLIGAGNYANNESVAVSATGHGEHFIRNLVAYDISARIIYAQQSLEEAAHYVIQDKLGAQGVNGGIIAIDKDGNMSLEFNTTAMFRAYVSSTGDKFVSIFK